MIVLNIWIIEFFFSNREFSNPCNDVFWLLCQITSQFSWLTRSLHKVSFHHRSPLWKHRESYFVMQKILIGHSLISIDARGNILNEINEDAINTLESHQNLIKDICAFGLFELSVTTERPPDFWWFAMSKRSSYQLDLPIYFPSFLSLQFPSNNWKPKNIFSELWNY